MKIRMVTDIMFAQCFYHVAASSFFEPPRLFSHHFESRPDIPFRKHLSEPFRCVIIRRQQIVFGIEPKDDVNLRLGACFRGAEGWSGDRETGANNQITPDSLWPCHWIKLIISVRVTANFVLGSGRP